MRDVGRAELGPLDERLVARFNGKPAVALGVVKQATANPLDVAEGGAEAAAARSAQICRKAWKSRIAYDTLASSSRDRSRTVYETIGEAILLVALVIFLFLRSIRATLIPLVTIPVSLIGAFAIMYAFGFTINTLTLLALVLAIGLVVDDAIVMLENIYRHVEEGMPPVKAALIGSTRDRLRHHRHDHHARRGLCADRLHDRTHRAAVHRVRLDARRRGDRLGLRRADALADDVLEAACSIRSITVCFYRIIERVPERDHLLATAALLKGALRDQAARASARVGRGGLELFPVSDHQERARSGRGPRHIFARSAAPEGATIEYTDAYAKKLEEIALKVPEADRVFSVVGQSHRLARTRHPPPDRLGESANARSRRSRRSIVPEMVAVPGVVAFPSNPPPLGQRARDKPISVVIQTSQPYDELQKMVDAVVEKAEAYPGLADVDTDLKLNKPQLDVAVDRDKAAAVGVEVDTLGRTLETLLGGRQVTRFKREGEQYDVIVKIADFDRAEPGRSQPHLCARARTTP